jgi:hypothetical protein
MRPEATLFRRYFVVSLRTFILPGTLALNSTRG